MSYKFLIILIIFCRGFSYNARYGGELYQDGKNAQNAALGGLSVSFADGCNPVLLKNIQTSSVHFSHKNKFGGQAQVTTLSYLNTKTKYPLYFGLTNRSVDNIAETRFGWVDINGNSIPESDELNYFNFYDIIQQEIGIQLSTIRFWGPYTLGFNIKPSFTSLAEYRSYSISSDIAAMLQPLHTLDVTLRLEDILWHKYWDSGTLETISPLIMSGIHYRFSTLSVGLETGSRIERNTLLHYHVGFEYLQQEQLFFRFGTSHSNQFTVGIGIQLPLIDFSYAYLYPSRASLPEESHIISIGINLDEFHQIKGKITP